MPYNFNFKGLEIKTLIISPKGWIPKLIIEYAVCYANPLDSYESVCWRIKGTTHTFKIPLENILVIYDDLSLDLGKLRFRANGSDGGHNGIKSIIKHLGTKDFARLKFGIGPQPPIPAEAFVLQNFSKEQLIDLKASIKRAVEAVEFYFENDIYKAQNQYN